MTCSQAPSITNSSTILNIFVVIYIWLKLTVFLKMLNNSPCRCYRKLIQISVVGLHMSSAASQIPHDMDLQHNCKSVHLIDPRARHQFKMVTGGTIVSSVNSTISTLCTCVHVAEWGLHTLVHLNTFSVCSNCVRLGMLYKIFLYLLIWLRTFIFSSKFTLNCLFNIFMFPVQMPDWHPHTNNCHKGTRSNDVVIQAVLFFSLTNSYLVAST